MFSELQTLNKEAFMLILSEIWDNWATKPVLQKAAKRVGITPQSLDVNLMQQDKFDRAESCIQKEIADSTPTSAIISPRNKRKGSALYWKDKFDQAHKVIEDMAERNIQIEEIPGLLTVKKVKPNMEKTSTRVTQVHGSMRAKDVASLVKDIKEQKEKRAQEKEETRKKKEEEKEAFLKCKEKCICSQKKCLALGLKQCPNCKSVLRSVCSKAGCQVNGKRPRMVLPGKKTGSNLLPKRLFPDCDSDSSENSDDIE